MQSLSPWMARHRGLVLGGVALCVAAGLAVAWSSSAASEPVEGSAIGPDVTVIYLPTTRNYGATGGVRAYSVATTSCNIGQKPLWWCDENRAYCDDTQHPVIAQNLYRLKEGRFEQIGMSWLKHGFLSLNTQDAACGNCQGPPHGGDQLGIGCTDAYSSTLNGSRPLGLRSEVDAATGEFPFPYTEVNAPNLASQRMQVAESDLAAASNPGARYWIEGHYVAADDAVAGKGLNNASYREVTVDEPSFDLDVTGNTIREKAAIFAWQAVDPAVELMSVDVPDSVPVQRFHVARKVTDLGGGVWHYEYAVHNMNAERAAHGFNIDFPGGATLTSSGFHDIDHHSGEPYATTDWVVSVNNTTGTIGWETDPFDVDEDANALRWGTMFTFWFDANQPPSSGTVHTLDIFKPGSPSSVAFVFPAEVFTDGFEAGNTSAWSSTVP